MKKSTKEYDSSYELIEFSNKLPQQDSAALILPHLNQLTSQKNNCAGQKQAAKTAPKSSSAVQSVISEKFEVLLAGNSDLEPRKLISVLFGFPPDNAHFHLDFFYQSFFNAERKKFGISLTNITTELFLYRNISRSQFRRAKGIIITADLTKSSHLAFMDTPESQKNLDWRTSTTKLIARIKEGCFGSEIPIFLVGMVAGLPFTKFSESSGFTEFVENNELQPLSTIVNIQNMSNVQASIYPIFLEIDRLSSPKQLIQNNNNDKSSCSLM